MVAPLKRVIVKPPREAYGDESRVAREWSALNYTAPPDLAGASAEHARLVEILRDAGAEVLMLPADDRTGLDSVYVHDPGLITDAGMIVFQTGKPARRGEGPALADALRVFGVPVIGTIEGEATAEGGDLVWLDARTLLAGRGFRTNAAGVARLSELLAPMGVEVVEVPLPYDNGPEECLHLMSFISMLDDDLAIVCRRLLPVPLFEMLTKRGVTLIDIADGEYSTQACNVLAVAPRKVVMLAGNPVTRARIEAAGCDVAEYRGEEISFKGAGGPTCLTRPIWRET
jgi:N-dimethylarginine dimethylaminohydrolase